MRCKNGEVISATSLSNLYIIVNYDNKSIYLIDCGIPFDILVLCDVSSV